ncbi:SagB family peptide dehydrogenase [Amycolatopsis suaedae]|uniref:SagB/ThcOx family dehydrogenase n=1 Tax=Amycolatopsis suaedae TaxID=2510978 RepID=A0A4Q7JAE1_9PSEU|nr:SagB family peptide dehydrogenase [Amycolatopsis suaedae]RZQ63936.1 SagB/ThcOx family dehydrogenase [Amycolatopsis suaedae]
MGNWDADLGDHYLRRTVHEAEELFAQVLSEDPIGPDPLPFKVYRGVRRYALPESVPLEIGDARVTLDGGPPPAVRSAAPDEHLLSALLYHGYGFSRWDQGPGAVWPYHRTVASARCYFPTELYLWTAGAGQLPAGLYHYDNLHHALESVREGDHRAELERVLATDLDGAHTVLLLSSLFWKNAHKYRGYSYRLCSQEAGMVAGNALLVAGALGLRGHAHYQFLDRDAGALLGLEPSEEHVFAVLPLYPASHEDGVVRRVRPGPAPVRTERHTHVRAEGPEHPHDDLFTSIAGNSWLEGEGEFAVEVPEAPAARPRCTRDAAVVAMPPPREEPIGLGSALRTRNSGNVLFNPVAKTLPLGDFWEIVRYATSPYASDLREGTGEPGLSLTVVAFDVAGLPRGVYRFCRGHGGLHPVAEGDFAMPLQGALPVPNLNLCASNFVCYLAADYAAASARFGNRAYRVINIEAGIVAQRLSVLSAAFGLSARVHNGYDAAGVESVLRLDEEKLTPFFQIAVAHNRAGVQVGLPLLF